MKNGNRLLSLLMVALGSVPSAMAVKRTRSPGQKPSSSNAQGFKRTDRAAGSKEVGKPGQNVIGGKRSSRKTFVLSDGGKERVMREGGLSREGKIAVGVATGLGVAVGTTGFGLYERHYADGPTHNRNLDKSAEYDKNGPNSFDKLPFYELKYDKNGKASLKTRPFVWVNKKGTDNWYVLFRRDNKTSGGALKDLGKLFEVKQDMSSSLSESIPTQESAGYNAAVIKGKVTKNLIDATAYTIAKKSVENVKSKKKTEKENEIRSRIVYELGGPEDTSVSSIEESEK